MNSRQLSEARQWIVERCQRINFGRITFQVRAGQPDLDEPCRIRRTVKLAGGDNGPRPESGLTDFELRREHIALLTTLRHTRDGAYVTVDVRHGLPFIVEIEQDHEAA